MTAATVSKIVSVSSSSVSMSTRSSTSSTRRSQGQCRAAEVFAAVGLADKARAEPAAVRAYRFPAASAAGEQTAVSASAAAGGEAPARRRIPPAPAVLAAARPAQRCAGTCRPARAYIGCTCNRLPSRVFLVPTAQCCTGKTRDSRCLHRAVHFFPSLGL